MNDIFLSSSEYDMWRAVHRCHFLGKVSGPRKTGYWWVAVDPPMTGSTTGLHGDKSEVLLAERYAGDDLAKLKDRAIPVYVCSILNREAVVDGTIREEDVALAGWAEVAREPRLLPTEKDS